MAMNVKKGDTVIVLSGKDKGKQGKVLGTVPSEAKVVVEGINMVTCHVKPRKQGETGGIVQREAAMYASKVQVVCPKVQQGHPHRAQDRKWQEDPRVQALRRRALRKESSSQWQD